MKLVGIIGTAVLSLTLAAPVYAQQEQHEQQEEQKAKPAQEEKKVQPEKKPEEKNAQQQQAKPAQRAGGSNCIPDDRYKANFGREHSFRVSQADYRNHRFEYGGYAFGFVGIWPSNWLYTQNVYVVEIDGMYYLCNPMYPGVNLELSIAL